MDPIAIPVVFHYLLILLMLEDSFLFDSECSVIQITSEDLMYLDDKTN